jgi:hypothetical protein
MSDITPAVSEGYYFATTVYKVDAKAHLETARTVAIEYLEKAGKQQRINDLYPVQMTDNMFNDPRLQDLSSMIVQMSWNILDAQGYQMNNLNTLFLSMWAQEHYKYSLMEQHTHGEGAQIIGFYFLDVPEDATTRMAIYDPRPAKVQINLPEKNLADITYGSNVVTFTPEPGTIFFTNAWIPHSFTRNGSHKPVRFIHFNIGVERAQQQPIQCPDKSSPEII